MHYTHHAIERMAQRGISREDIEAVIETGECFYQRARTVYYAGDKGQGRTKNVAVILSSEGDVVISVLKTGDRKKLRLQGEKGKTKGRLNHRQLRYQRKLTQNAY